MHSGLQHCCRGEFLFVKQRTIASEVPAVWATLGWKGGGGGGGGGGLWSQTRSVCNKIKRGVVHWPVP